MDVSVLPRESFGVSKHICHWMASAYFSPLSCYFCFLSVGNSRISLMSSLLPGFCKQEILLLTGPSEVSVKFLFHIFFFLPHCPGANLSLEDNAKKQSPEEHTGNYVPFHTSPVPLNVLASLWISNLSSNHAKAPCRSSVCPLSSWVWECAQLGLSRTFLVHSCYFLNLVCELFKWWAVVTLQKSPPSLSPTTEGIRPLPRAEPWQPGNLTLPHLL